MAFKKNYHRRNYKKRKTTYTKPLRYEVADTAYNAYRGVKWLARQINVEHKEYIQNTTVLSSTAGTMASLNLVPHGSGSSSRDGSSIKNIRLSGRMAIKQGVGGTNDLVRIIIYQVKQDSCPNVAGVDGFLGSASPLSRKDTNNKFKTKTLWDRLYRINDQIPCITTNLNIKLYGHTTFEGNTNKFEDGEIKILVISDNGVGGPGVEYNLQFTYTDN